MSGRSGGIRRRQRPPPERIGGGGGQRDRGGRNAPKLFRNKTVNTVLVVPTRARKYRQALYIFAFILMGFGLTLLSLSITMLVFDAQGLTILPAWLFTWLVAIGVLTMGLSAIGGRGAVVSNRKLETGEFNWWLIILAVTMIISLLGQFGAIGLLALSYDIPGLSSLKSAADGANSAINGAVQQQFRDRPQAWWDWQKANECCGYQNNTIPAPLATGKFCTNDKATSGEPCYNKLWASINSSLISISAFVIVFLISEIAVCVSSMCLACFIKAQEPVYAG